MTPPLFLLRHLRETLGKFKRQETYRRSLDLELNALEAWTATTQRLELRPTEDVVQRPNVAVKEREDLTAGSHLVLKIVTMVTIHNKHPTLNFRQKKNLFQNSNHDGVLVKLVFYNQITIWPSFLGKILDCKCVSV